MGDLILGPIIQYMVSGSYGRGKGLTGLYTSSWRASLAGILECVFLGLGKEEIGDSWLNTLSCAYGLL